MNTKISQGVRRIITRGVIDMATSRVLESEGYDYIGPMALCDAEDEARIAAKIDAALATHFGKVKDTLTAFEGQLKDNGRVTDKIKEEIAGLNKDGGKLVADQVEFRKQQDQRILDLEQKLAAANDPALLAARARGGQSKSLGELFIESKQFLDSDPKSKAGSTARFNMAPFEVKSIISNVNSGGAGAFPEYLPTPVIPAFQPLTIRDLLSSGTTDTNIINWVQENVFTDNAGYQGSDGVLKPQSDISYVLKTTAVATLAHSIKASKQILSDFKQLQTLINARLSFGLKLAEEREILFGDGATNHLHGLVPQSTAYNTGLNKAGDQMLDVLRHAMLQTTLSFYPPTGVALSPTDWHNIELLKDGFHRYLFSNPAGTIPAMVWGLPVAQCFSFGAGDFLVGSLKLAVTLFDREQATILVSTEDQDNFVKNMITILAEERLALTVARPTAVVWGAFPAQSST
jgi:HK97 family phage major capsid protein